MGAGLLVWSLALMAEGRDLAAAIVFTFLVTMKHLFACLGPLYAVHLLRHYCRHEICCVSLTAIYSHLS